MCSFYVVRDFNKGNNSHLLLIKPLSCLPSDCSTNLSDKNDLLPLLYIFLQIICLRHYCYTVVIWLEWVQLLHYFTNLLLTGKEEKQKPKNKTATNGIWWTALKRQGIYFHFAGLVCKVNNKLTSFAQPAFPSSSCLHSFLSFSSLQEYDLLSILPIFLPLWYPKLLPSTPWTALVKVPK